MRDAPPGWPRISTAIYYDDPARAIDWLCAAFGFEVKIKVLGEDGGVEHSELTFGGGLVMVGRAKERFAYRRSPRALGGANTQSLMVYVDDAEAHCARARVAGAVVVREPETVDYGEGYWVDRGYECEDPEGHHWWFYERVRER